MIKIYGNKTEYQTSFTAVIFFVYFDELLISFRRDYLNSKLKDKQY